MRVLLCACLQLPATSSTTFCTTFVLRLVRSACVAVRLCQLACYYLVVSFVTQYQSALLAAPKTAASLCGFYYRVWVSWCCVLTPMGWPVLLVLSR
jgi:hypothetical protein